MSKLIHLYWPEPVADHEAKLVLVRDGNGSWHGKGLCGRHWVPVTEDRCLVTCRDCHEGRVELEAGAEAREEDRCPANDNSPSS